MPSPTPLPDAEPPQADGAEQAEHNGGVDRLPTEIGKSGSGLCAKRGHGRLS